MYGPPFGPLNMPRIGRISRRQAVQVDVAGTGGQAVERITMRRSSSTYSAQYHNLHLAVDRLLSRGQLHEHWFPFVQ